MNKRVFLAVASFTICLSAPILGVSVSWGQEEFGQQVGEEQAVDFAKEVLPILSNKCFLCHGPDSKDEDLVRLDSYEGATVDLGGYRAIDVNSPDSSVMLERINSKDDPMPPIEFSKSLNKNEKELLSRWIRQGGKYSNHWAFENPKKSDEFESPRVAIDHYVSKKLATKNLAMAPVASRPTLARRVALVLTGLPPEPAQLRRYLQDESETAYANLVDELFASPRFGEHQARYWLDAVRYGDTHGLHLDNRRGIYPYRDWIVKAYNDNLPLDEFITWQLAGDLLPNPTLEQKVATGFIRLNPSTGEGGAIPAEFQVKNSFDRTENFGTVFLGLSLNCARCHNHKYDPITQKEYYQLLAFFNSTAESPMDGNSYTYGDHLPVPGDVEDWYDWEDLATATDKLLEQANLLVATESTLATFREDWLTLADDEKLRTVARSGGPFQDSDLQAYAKVIQKGKERVVGNFTTTLVARELTTPRPTHLLNRGEYDQPVGDPIQPGVFEVLQGMPDNMPRNRLGLAKWLTSRNNPLTSRVLVNQIWQKTFGHGLVRSPEDFGRQGQQPTHPALLDWLAVDFQESGWDHKSLLRNIVLSDTFRQNSTWRNELEDPKNELLGRGPSYRLDAEVIRDVGLWASHLLDPKMGGEGVKPYQPDGMWQAMAHPASNTKKYQRDHGPKLYRRSLYVYWKRTSPHPMMTLFDAPSRESSCLRREPTNTSLQSLALLNETQRIEMSRFLAARIMREHKETEARTDQLFQLLACRPPNEQERSACLKLLSQMKKRYRNDKVAANQLLAVGEKQQGRINVVECAAWTQLAATLLASDAVIMLY